jgi:hypothetical protein
MFLENSRYAKVLQEETETATGRKVTAIRLRTLPPITGEPYSVIDRDRLDLLAQAHYGDGTRYWHIADANTVLQAGDLTAETGAHINLPKT